MPNDDEEFVRLEVVNFVMRSMYGRNVLAPINSNPSKILDVGAGSGISPTSEEEILRTGLWTIEVADQFPTTRVIGMDLSPIQPGEMPLNCEFVVGDLTKDLDLFDDGSVDLVHSR
jgi:ubiquinone/menaquinone biosynthesis C-methylase UbiE